MAFFYLSICLSAFLLFLVEPLIGKTLLPWFGGTAAVWSTSMVFFQIMLTGGYAYAAWLSQGKRRRVLHGFLLAGSLLLMLALSLFWRSPITPSDDLNLAATIPPAPAIFILLGLAIGLPFFLLASNSTLVQAWFHRADPARSPYRLYVFSNLSSLAALLLYPTLLEPNLPLPGQGWLWSGAYLLFALLTFYGLIRQGSSKNIVPAETVEPAPRPGRKTIALWVGLSACASILLLSITNYLTQQVAVIPFLWVLPLAIYLATFALAFAGEKFYPRSLFVFALVPVILLYDLAMVNGGLLGVPLQIGIFSLLLFLGCMVCNGELYRLRPPAVHMPSFYLLISIGGALGGLLVTFVAPALFNGFWELPLGVLLFCALFLLVGRGAKGEGLKGEIVHRLGWAMLGTAVLIAAVRTFSFIGADLTGSVHTERNFYGVIRVRQSASEGETSNSYQLINGSTIHGAQFLGPDERRIPTVYYGPEFGVGLALLNYPRTPAGIKVGALGLGVGTIAAYSQPGDLYRFYEINPADILLAQGQGGYFTYLTDSKADIDVVQGDARLSLQQEVDYIYDLLVLDVFNNDSIPVHLMNEQAFTIYLDHLQPNGVLAVHITNAYLDLTPVVAVLAGHFDLGSALIVDPGDGHYTSPSTWMLLTRDASFLSQPAILSRSSPLPPPSSLFIRLWTDDYSNLFQLLKH